ncbi:hypothetical protein A2154_01975 [Candidatus Gottesmanbacteria bacterium RBG_16_43_7]|uniref:Prolipoprotein diacylglyceryl transferase n=1 Tax=Candidatus Gottesmanbacteria bacterium RBG_16_43_7 TaxID=1798373 RepID=A0A1F5Z8I8_9BACT|nr:MAG: hypothetical protein A2154_01975 [Candidatus Gottesmanbacteria bacterium RBG_16_43_7]
MHPVLITIGSIRIFSLSAFLILAFLVFSFSFWFELKDRGVNEERIFDLTFYAAIVSFICARAVYVIFNFSQFGYDVLKMAAIWVSGGMSFYGGIIAAIFTMIWLSKQYKIPSGYIIDSLAFSLPVALSIGYIGSLLDGGIMGKPLPSLPGIYYLGQIQRRHPVQLYYLVVLFIIFIILYLIRRRSYLRRWTYGVLGVWFFLLFALSAFTIEFFTESSLYLGVLSINQWLLLAVISESLGFLLVKHQVLIRIGPLTNTLKSNIFGKISVVYERFNARISNLKKRS